MSYPPSVLFEPIVDTAARRVLAHQCDAGGMIDAAIRCAAANSPAGSYFIRNGSFSPRFTAIWKSVGQWGLRPASLVFEVTESALARDPKRWHGVCEWYRRRGFGLALADAGNSPGCLQIVDDLRPDYVKLEKSLVRGMERARCAATIHKLAELTEPFGAAIVADGVEHQLTVENLWLLGVYLMQGSLFGIPVEHTRSDAPLKTMSAGASGYCVPPG